MPEKVIGIMGGQGPEATLDLFRRIIQNTPANTDQDHFHIIIDCNPKVPNPNNAVMTGLDDPTGMLCANAKNLQKAGADFIVIPCNTAHIFLDAIRASIEIPVMSIVDATVGAVTALQGVTVVGLLASAAVVKTGLYARALEAKGIQSLVPSEYEQQDIRDIIVAVKAGDKSQPVREKLFRVCSSLTGNGAQALILGCTELPLLAEPSDFPVPVVDTLEVLALTAIQTARGI